jgi:hypothetical protein
VLSDTSALTVAAAVVVGVLASARLTRLLVVDDYPPAVWARQRWHHVTREGSWAELVDCPYCAAPWVTLPVLMTAVLSDLHPAWWLFCGWLAASYVASMVVAYDGS